MAPKDSDFRNIYGTCNLVYLLFLLSLFCNETSSQGNCGEHVSNYNVLNLTASRSWDLTTDVGCIKEVNCIYHFAFCHPLPSISNTSCINGAVCQESSVNKATYLLGNYSDSVDPSSPSDTSNGFSFNFSSNIEIPNQSKANETCKPNVIFNFYCNPNAYWIILNETGSNPAPPGQISFHDCQFMLNFSYSGACMRVLPVIPPQPSLSSGSILLIIFFVASAIYLFGGTILNYCVGARGIELVPNIDFWRDFPALVVDGCNFFYYHLTCQNRPVIRYDSI